MLRDENQVAEWRRSDQSQNESWMSEEREGDKAVCPFMKYIESICMDEVVEEKQKVVEKKLRVLSRT